MQRRLIANTLFAVLLLAACGAPGASPADEPTVERILITTEDAPAQACMDALISGQLVAHDKWGLALQVPGTGELIRPIFPFGYSAARDGQRIVLLDEGGELVARSGDLIQAGGGFVGGEGGPNSAALCAGSIEVVPG